MLLSTAREAEPAFYPLLGFLLHTGCRKREARAVKWEDVDWHASRVLSRRSVSRGKLTPPKSGKARSVAPSPAPAAILRDLLAERRRQCLKRKWALVPEFIFCSETGGLLDERNITRSWHRVRHKAQAKGIRPLRLHDARHLRQSRARVGQERPVGRRAARPRQPRADPARLAPDLTRSREECRLHAEYEARNKRISEMLEAKGFGLSGDEPGGVQINCLLRLGKIGKDSGD